MAGLIAPLVALGLVADPGGAEAPSQTERPLSASQLTPTDRVAADKAPSSRLAQTDQELLARNDAELVNVMIKLDYDSVATYQGGVAGLDATSPRTTGEPLSGESAAEEAYGDYITTQEEAFAAELQTRVPSATLGRSVSTVFGGVAAKVPANAVETILDIDGVAAVQYDHLNQPLTDSSPDFVNAPPVYDELGTVENAGEGVIYGNLDTGIWPEHPSFADLGNLDAPPGPARECNYGENPLTDEEDPFECQNKLIGGAWFTQSYDACADAGACSPDPLAGTARDSNGHGTHTASTSAGNIVEDVEVLGFPRPPIHGLAPGAWVMEYKVCGPDGCFSSDSAAAVGQAILDGVDAINFSISGGTTPFTDPVELAFLDAYAANVFVSASAGNSGPGAGTSNHLGPWTTTVAASTQTREFATTLTLNADNGDTFTADGASITAGVDEFPVVFAQDVEGYDDPLCGTPPPSDTIFEGLIVACERGVQARVLKGFHVFSGGGEGHVLYNPVLMDNETDNHWLPTVHLADGTDFVAFMESHTGVTGSFPAGEEREGQGDVMAAFSSRGPAGLVIKPDVTAPGVQVLAGNTPFPGDPAAGSGPPGEFFQAIAGTSMSSPHVAGAALLVRAVHPDWTPGQIKSALMTTSITDVVKEDLATPADPFDFGAGRIDVGESIYAPITFDETADNFFAMGNDPVQAVHLNLPSINAPVLPGRLTTTRVATNTSGVTERFRALTDAPEGSSIRVQPRNITIGPGESATLTITIETDAPVGVQQFGTIWLESRAGHLLHLPVAFIHTQGSVNLVQSCSPATVHIGGQSRCTVEGQNNSPEEQVVNLDTFTSRDPNLKIIGVEGATLVNVHHAQLHGVTLAGFQPGVPSVDPGASPGGYLPLDAFGIVPEPIGDEEFIGFGTPPFVYNGVTYDQFGVNSNGYIVAGEFSGEDNNCCNIPDGPSPARPNNVLAPLWSDLDGTDAEGIFAAILTDGVNSWIVIESRLTDFAGSEVRVFQVWIGIDGVQDISFVYDPDNLPSDLTWPFLVGAENVAGDGDMEAVLPTEDLRVESTDPVPGDVVSYAVTVKGTELGVGLVTSEMTASRSPGVTIVDTEVRVIRRRPGGGAVAA
ncbi:MAG: S8 family serine peptidase [Acidimicrobiales bacterium]